MLEPAIRELATIGKNFATVCVTLPGGAIASHVMWIDADDDHVIFNTERHRAKFRALEHDPRVTVTIWAAENPYAYAEVRGHVVDTIGGIEARAHIDALSQRYFGYDYRNPITSERVIVKVLPDRQRTVHL
jgi:PPOX class probable F420-dependent enzyme